MTPETVVQIIRDALMVTFWLSAPLLAIGFVASIVMSLIQIATSIQDAAFSTIPRPGGFSGGHSVSVAVDAPEKHGVYGRTVRRFRPVCPLASRFPWAPYTRSFSFWRAWGAPWFLSRYPAPPACRKQRASRWR
jgi:hypothetical protein